MKRILDLIASLYGLIILAPILLVVAILVRLKLGSPVLFKQTRPGKNDQPFKMIKFRTMTDAVSSDGNILPDEDRLTSFGLKLRELSLDELPELWNVVKGNMSIVGPRPLLMEYVDLYTTEQARRNLVRPGLTGWAQIKGRNGLSWEEKFRLDCWYVDNRSFLLDLQIILITVVKVIRKDGISAEGMVTMSRFRGSKNELEDQ